jgi:hypothetical protein
MSAGAWPECLLYEGWQELPYQEGDCNLAGPPSTSTALRMAVCRLVDVQMVYSTGSFFGGVLNR